MYWLNRLILSFILGTGLIFVFSACVVPSAPIPATTLSEPSIQPSLKVTSVQTEEEAGIQRALKLPYLEAGNNGRGSPNIQLYCVMSHHTSDFVLSDQTVNGWHCKKGDQLLPIQWDDLCKTQFKYSSGGGYDQFDNPASVYCKVEGEWPTEQYRYPDHFSPYTCDANGFCRLRNFKFRSQTDTRIVSEAPTQEKNIWENLTYKEGLCAPTSLVMALDTLMGLTPMLWLKAGVMNKSYSSESNEFTRIRLLSEFFDVNKNHGVPQQLLFNVSDLAAELNTEGAVAAFEHVYPFAGSGESLRAAMQNRKVPLISYGRYRRVEELVLGEPRIAYERISGHMEVLYGFDQKSIYSVNPGSLEMNFRPFEIKKNMHCAPNSLGKSNIEYPLYGNPCVISVIREANESVTFMEGVTFLRLGVQKK